MPDTLFSFETLASLSGAAMLTFLVVLYTGRVVDKWWKWGTDLYAVFWGFVILLLASLANGASARDWQVYVLCVFNAFVIAAAAGKLRDKSISEQARKYESKQEETYDYRGI
jgi:hypothetical protein